MNERITILGDTSVEILRQRHNRACDIKVRCDDKGGMWVEGELDRTRWDAEGRAALRDCINCLEATGSFAALRDESAVPFVGKRVRIGVSDQECSIVEMCGSHARLSGGRDWVDATTLLPLTPPPPRFRPYSNALEAANALWGEWSDIVRDKSGRPWRATEIDRCNSVVTLWSVGECRKVTFDELLEYTIGGEVCGVAER